jgi:hypothetical protein
MPIYLLLVALPCGGFLVGFYTILFGLSGLIKGEFHLTSKLVLDGGRAVFAGFACILLGICLIGLAAWSWQFLPD